MLQSHSRMLICGASLLLSAGRSAAQENAVQPPTRNVHYEQRALVGKNGEKLDYWLMSPAKVEPDNKYPLVLALHGRGGNTEAAGVLGSDEMRAKYPCFVLAPAPPRPAVWVVPRDIRQLQSRQLLPLALEALESVKANQPIDADRIYVTGQSMGGFGTFGAVAASPQTFAAAMPICGGGDPANAAGMKGVAFWVFHGDRDNTVPVDRSRQMVEALKQAGGTPKYTEYAGVGHNSWTKAHAAPETWEWLFAQKRTQ